MASAFSVENARAQFPALAKDQIFGDNAGGSQVLGTVAKSISEYLVNNNVQLGASYRTSKISTQTFDKAYKVAADYINADVGEIVIAPSTTQAFRNLAAALKLKAGDEVILSEVDHESNIDPWLHYATLAGATVKWWAPSDRLNPKLDAVTLRSLLTPNTRFVACTHASNILGSIHDIKAFADVVHEVPGALLCVDGVAYAPHRAIDVKVIGADFYAFSWYKVYGPHISLLYGSFKAQEHLQSLGHYFNPSGTLMDKLELAAASYELTQAIMPLVEYFGENPKQTWAGITQHEEALQKHLLDFLKSHPDVCIRGDASSAASVRVPTVSFTVKGRSSQSVVEGVEAQSIAGIRWGHFFSKRLAEKILGLGEDGVVRLTYNHCDNRLPDPHTKYTGFQQIHNPNRKWPNQVLTKPPVWLSTDLRDGNQSLINPLTIEQKWEYFQMLVEIGYTEIEVCFPAASQVEFDFTRRLIETPNIVPDTVRLRGLSPTREDFLARTVAALRGAKRASVCTYICVSDKQLKYQGFTREKALEQAVRSVRYLRSITKDDPESAAVTDWTMAFGLESYNEADHHYAVQITEAVKEAWEPTVEDPLVVVLATSTEVATPNVFADQVETFRAALSDPEKISISIHTHNDRGCGVAAAELGMLAGADMVEGCLFGNGERAGNVDLVTLALNLYSRGIHPGLDFSKLYEIKRKYEKLTGLIISQRMPYTGEFALQAFSGSHQNIIRKGIAQRVEAAEKGIRPIWDIPYLPLDPEDLGIPLDTIIRVNSQSGKAAATWILNRRWGLDIPVELQVNFGGRVQMMCEALAREISHQEVINLFIASYALTPSEKHDSASNIGSISVTSDGTLQTVVGMINPADSFAIRIDGTGPDIASAVVRGLHFMKDVNAVAKIHHTQQLSERFDGKFCVLATCVEGDKTTWGYFIDENEENAQAMSVVSASLHMYRRKLSTLPLKKQNTMTKIATASVSQTAATA
ncbi:2-isopropylmalate synthase [Colletotrichum salicis]|uniref:2-isopropylmalate synthase n=1 Tax=Colletotrichum salicis TaxID=1209931 RepID=A0A135UEK4_9PEZI|nr:2-isopropylmalate synthase [Colletotrichum salicis]